MTALANITTLRPGLLVSLKTSLRGNVSYVKETLEANHVVETGEARERWETERTVADPEEYERAAKARHTAGDAIRRVCAKSAFGLLCPESGAEELEKAIAAANKVAADFNASARMTRLTVYVITGRIAADDVEAVRAINSEVRDLLSDMEQGLRNMDVKAVRDAANKARGIGQMLTPEARARIQLAIDAARVSARAIVKAGETAAVEIDQRAIRAIVEQRTLFLDLDEAAEVQAPQDTGRAIDFAPEAEVIAAQAPKAPAIELGD